MKYRIADYNLSFDGGKWGIDKCKDFETDFDNADYEIEITQSDLQYEANQAAIDISDPRIPHVAIYRKLASWLPHQNAVVFHSVAFDVDGVGVVFAAHSGVGKSTHLVNWKKLLNERLIIVDGDKPIVRFFDNEPNVPYVYGTPWNGKESWGNNMRTPLKHICFIERSETNYVEKVDKKQIVDRIFNQVYMPKDPMAIMNTMKLIDRLLNRCSLWIIHCNMELESAQIAYDTIINNK